MDYLFDNLWTCELPCVSHVIFFQHDAEVITDEPIFI